jgi:hypothetical protein
MRFLSLLQNLDQTRPALYLGGLFRNWRECLTGLWHFLFLRFFHRPGKGKQALLVEFNAFHGETLPGFAHYFQELGYEVTVLTRHASWADSPFVRMPVKPRHYCLTIWGLRHYLKSRKARDFSIIFYNSLFLYLKEYRYIGTVRDFLGGHMVSGRDNWFGIEHHFYPQDREALQATGEHSPQQEALRKHAFLLTSVNFGAYAVPMLNPCYFGIVQAKCAFSAGPRRVFIAIGNVSRKTRNFPELFRLIRENGLEDALELRIIGKVVDRDLLKTLPRNANVLGRMTFEQMYQQLEEADFFLPLLSPDTQANYLDGCTSGSRQLVLGFSIPPIIHRAFAQCYGFTKESCLPYEDLHGLLEAIGAALKMNDGEYAAKCRALAEIQKIVMLRSRMNLQDRLTDS